MAKKATKAKRTKAKGKSLSSARPESKATLVLEMMRRSKGATADELVKKTGWQPHTLRGFISGSLRKKLGLNVKTERDDKVTTYSISD